MSGKRYFNEIKNEICLHQLPYFSIDKFVKNEHAQYTLEKYEW